MVGATLHASDDAAVAVQDPELRGWQSDDADALLRTRRGDVLPRPVHPAGGRLHAGPGRDVAAADHGRRVPAVQTVRRPRRSARAAAVHGRWPDRRRPRVAAARPSQRQRRLRDADSPGRARVRARALGHGRAADGDRARLGRARALGRRERYQQRGLSGCRTARDRRARGGRLRQLHLPGRPHARHPAARSAGPGGPRPRSRSAARHVDERRSELGSSGRSCDARRRLRLRVPDRDRDRRCPRDARRCRRTCRDRQSAPVRVGLSGPSAEPIPGTLPGSSR